MGFEKVEGWFLDCSNSATAHGGSKIPGSPGSSRAPCALKKDEWKKGN
jgi:hypothetical protein